MRKDADYLLRELAWEDWFVAAVMSPPKIIIRRRVRGLKDLPSLFKPFGKRMLPSVHLGKLAEWIGETVGDEKLGKALEEIDKNEAIAYLQKCELAGELIEERLNELHAFKEASHV